MLNSHHGYNITVETYFLATMEAHSIAISSTCLCLGPKQSGKTHLLSSLQSSGSITNVSHSVPTIGTNIFTIRLSDGGQKQANSSASAIVNGTKQKAVSGASGGRRSTKNPSVTIMEVGGSMAAMWSSYLNNVSKILFVIDTSNLCQISAAGKFGYTLLIYTYYFLI